MPSGVISKVRWQLAHHVMFRQGGEERTVRIIYLFYQLEEKG